MVLLEITQYIVVKMKIAEIILLKEQSLVVFLTKENDEPCKGKIAIQWETEANSGKFDETQTTILHFDFKETRSSLREIKAILSEGQVPRARIIEISEGHEHSTAWIIGKSL